MSDIAQARQSHAGQFRLTRLQVVDWGTFCGYKDMPIDERGVLFTGPSGSGKSSLLDSLSVALLPSRDQRFNASADLTAKGAKQGTRNTVDYVRGAFRESSDEHGHAQIQYLRGGQATWSAIGATYDNAAGSVITGVVIRWFAGTETDGKSLKSLFLVHDGDFDLTVLNEWAHQQEKPFDTKWLRSAYPKPATSYPPSEGDYTRELAKRVGIGAAPEMALSLLGKAKAMKNVGDLDMFIRGNMLDRPETFGAATAMIETFNPLNEAFETAQRAYQQQRILDPVPGGWAAYRTAKQQANLAESLQGETVNRYLRGVNLLLLTAEIDQLGKRIKQLTTALGEQQQHEAAAKRAYQSLNDQLREEGKALTDLEDELERVNEETGHRRDRYSAFRRTVEHVNTTASQRYPLPEDQDAFAALKSQVADLLPDLHAQKNALNAPRREAAAKAGEAARTHREKAAELAALLQTSGSLIPLKERQRREVIAHGAGVPVEELAYTAELIDVADGEERWLPAAEKLLRNFGLRLLVPYKHRDAVKGFIDQNDMRGIVEYSIVTAMSTHQPRPAPDTIAGKLTVDPGHPSGMWLAGQLAKQFMHVCVETARDLEDHPIAVTIRGTVKLRGNHYRKDDRPELTQPSSYILGANIEAKRAALEAEVAELDAAAQRADTAANNLDKEWQATGTAIDAATQVNACSSWTDLDHWSTAKAAADLEDRIAEVKASNVDLEQLRTRCDEAEEEWRNRVGDCTETKRQIDADHARREQLTSEHERENSRPHTVEEGADREYLDGIYLSLPAPRSSEQMPDYWQSFCRDLDRRRREADADQRAAATTVQAAVNRFLEDWDDYAPDDSGDIDRCGADFVALHTEITQRRLPEAMSRFQEMISEDMIPSINVLCRTIETATADIKRRIKMVNTGLQRVEFDQGTHLQIGYTPRQFDAVKEFRDIINKLHLHAPSASRDPKESLRQFARVRALMARFTADDTESKRWAETVLDVGQTFTFYGREEDTEGNTVVIHRNTSTNSGGEQEKLVAFCLAAALSYHLADPAAGTRPRFAPLMLDEAFSKSDETFTTQGLAAFEEFGFQLITAAPIRMSGLLEPFIGQAILVEKRVTPDGHRSSTASATFGELAVRRAAEADGASDAAA